MSPRLRDSSAACRPKASSVVTYAGPRPLASASFGYLTFSKDMCTSICKDMYMVMFYMDMCTRRCIGMCIGVHRQHHKHARVDMHIDMCVDVCTDM